MAFAVVFSGQPAFAATGTWNITGDGNWNVNGNWNGASFPVAADTATFAGSTSYTVYLNGAEAANSLNIANTASTTFLGGDSVTSATNTLTLGSGLASGTLSISAGAGNVTFGDAAGNAKVDLIPSNTSAGYVISNLSSTGTLTFNGGIMNQSTQGRGIELRGATSGTSNMVFNGVLQNNPGGGTLFVRMNNATGGAGIYAFNAANTYTGGFTYDAASGSTSTTLLLGNDTALGTGTVTLQGGNAAALTIQSPNGPRTISNNIIFTANGSNTFSGSNSITLSGSFTHSSGRTLSSSITGGGLLTISGNVFLNNSNASSSTLTLAGTGNTNITGAIANNSGSNTLASNLTINNTGITTLNNNNTFSGALAAGAGSTVILNGSNAFTGNVTLNNGSLLKLGNANAVLNMGIFNVASTASTTLWLASDSSVNNLKANATSPIALTFVRVIADRATSGSAVNQSFDFSAGQGLGQQTDWTFQKGSLTTAGTATVGFNGTTVFGINNSSNKVTVINPLGVNMNVGNITASGGGASNINSTLVLDGDSAGNALTGSITSGSNTGTVTTATIASGSGNTITVNSATGYTVGMPVSGAGIAAGSVITNVSGTVLTLSQTPSSPSGTLTGANVNLVALVKAGPGTWSLSGSNAFGGTTTVQGGTLNLDFNAAGAPASNILYNGFVTAPTLNIGSGTLLVTGKAGASSTQSLSAISQTANGYSGKIVLSPGASGGTVTLNVTALTLNTSGGAMLDISSSAGNMSASGAVLNNSGAVLNNFISSQLTVNNGTDFAYSDGSRNIVTPTSGNYNAGFNASSSGTSTTYYSLTGGLTRVSGTDFTFQGIKLSSTGTDDALDLNGGTLTARASNRSTVLYTGGGNNSYIITNGTVRSGASSSELILAPAAGKQVTLNSSAALADNGAGLLTVTKSSDGTLVVAGTKTYTGKTFVLGGVFSIDTIAPGTSASGIGASGTSSANLVLNGGVLKYTGTGGTTDRSFTVGSNGATIDASGSGAITWAPGGALAYTSNQNNYVTLTGTSTGANTFGGGAGIIADAANGNTTLTKSGAGTWVLAGANTHTGGAYLNGGILRVSGTETAGTSGPLGKSGPIVFRSGTLQYSASNVADYSKRIILSTSGISIDTNGQSVAFASPLDGSNTGGLTKVGNGILTLNAPSSHSGTTTIAGGTLALGPGGSVAQSPTISVGAGATLNVSAVSNYTVGTTQTLMGTGTVAGAASVAGAIAPGNSIGTLTTGSLSLAASGTLAIEINTTAITSDKVAATDLTIASGAKLTLSDLGGNVLLNPVWNTPANVFSILSYSGALTNNLLTYNSNQLTDGEWFAFGANMFEIDYNYNGNEIALLVVPEPSSVALSLLAGAGMLLMRRRRR